MTFRPFIIQCEDQARTKTMLAHLQHLGYAASLGGLEDWADDYPTYWAIGIHTNGQGINTRSDAASLRRDIPCLAKATVFSSSRHFLTSNRNVDIRGVPHAHEFV